MPRSHRILSLNGGGTAGYASCLVLERLEAEMGMPCSKIFDLIAGVSTGSIIAGALGIGMPAASLVRLYEHEIPVIFSKPRWPLWRGYAGPAKYDSGPLDRLLKSVFKDCSIDWTEVNCMIHATQIAPRLIPKFWKTWDAADTNVLLADIIRASCAAPTYFSPKTIGTSVFVDGSVVACNPSHCAVAEAVRLGHRLNDISLLNIQLNDSPTYSRDQAEGMNSSLDWAVPISNIMLNTSTDISEYITRHLISDYINIDFNFPQAIDFWSDAFAKDTRARVAIYWEINRKHIVESIFQGRTTTPLLYAPLKNEIKGPSWHPPDLPRW